MHRLASVFCRRTFSNTLSRNYHKLGTLDQKVCMSHEYRSRSRRSFYMGSLVSVALEVGSKA
jgi:hypothetical protein